LPFLGTTREVDNMDEHIRDCKKKAAIKLRRKAIALNGLAEILKSTNDYDDWGCLLGEIYDGMLDLIDELEGDEG
jgi:hypothetical protein